MKRLISFVAFATLLAAFAPVFAQQGDRKGQAQQHMQEMAEALSLTDDQAQQFQDIHVAMMKEHRALREQELPREEMRTQGKAIRDKYEPQIVALLDEDQYETYKQMMAEMRKERRQRREN